MPLEDVRTHETVHIEVGDCLIDVDGLKQTERTQADSLSHTSLHANFTQIKSVQN
jgi:hypothetical protein